MTRIRAVLRSHRAEGYIDTVVSVMVMMMLIVLSINVFSFLTAKQDLDYFAREMVEAAAVNGDIYSNNTYTRYSELCDEVGFFPEFYWTADYYDGYYGRVQYGESIRVTVQYTKYLAGFGIFRIPVTMTATYSTLSKVYWK